jgi:Phage tail protein
MTWRGGRNVQAELQTLSIDGLELIDTDAYWFESADGLDEPDRRIASAVNPGADGGFVASTLYGMRGVSLTGALKRQDSAEMSAARSALGQVCLLKRDANGVRQLKTINFSLLDGREFTFQAEVSSFKAPNFGTGAVEFLIQLIAEDPLLYDPEEKSSGDIVRATGGGLIIPFVSPAVSAASSGGSGIATNNGNSDTPVIMKLVGPLTSPYILNQASGLFMQLDYTIPAGTTVLIDTSDNTILIEAGGSLFDRRSSGASFFKLLPGANPIVFSTSDSSDTGHVELLWHDGSICP